jgi:uncharacterized protein (TIGR00255 family)
MIRSMTGYGEAERSIRDGRVRLTIRTVNHRFLNAHIRTPPGFERLEAEIQSWLRQVFSRGHVNYTLSIEREKANGEDRYPEVDLGRARHYRDLLLTLKSELDLPGEVEVSSVLGFNDVFRIPEPTGRDTALDPDLLKDLTDEVARAVLEMREREGAHLKKDLEEGLGRLEGTLASIRARAPERLVAERDRLREAVRELSEQAEVDEDRLAKEVAYLADRWDLNEELVRFGAHVGAFRDTLALGGGEAIGKRLGFLVQEMHREANTIASKANDLEIGHASVSLKEEIERLREQLENIE